jgi:glycosyltransferase involved in cell wall biosynthesis
MNEVDVSVITCTRNRAASLQRMLDSVAQARIPEGLRWEFIVVDNGSTDATPSVLAEFAKILPLRSLVEPIPGAAYARNRGAADSRGELVLWIDDDVMVDPEWLSAYVEAAKRFPDAGFFAGNVTPVLEEPVSEWFAAHAEHPTLGILMARRRYSQPSSLITKENLPFSVNMGVRGDLQRRHRFDPRLGVSPLHNRTGEETNFLLEIMQAGAEGVSVPSANVRHFITASRQTTDYVRRYFAAHGETWALVRREPGFFLAPQRVPSGRLTLAGVPAWAVRNVLRAGALAKWAELTGNWNAWLDNVSEYEYFKAAVKFLYNNRKFQ